MHSSNRLRALRRLRPRSCLRRKSADGQSVLPRDGSGSENIDAVTAKALRLSRRFLLVSGYDVYDRKGSSEIVSPTYDRNFGIAFVLLKAVNHVDMQGDFLAGVGLYRTGTARCGFLPW